METKIVMQYKRSKPAWVCWNCEMENDLMDHNCYFCRAARGDAKILRPWVEERVLNESFPPAAPFERRKREAEFSAMRADFAPRSTSAYTPEPKSAGWVPLLIWGIVLTLLVLVVVAMSNA